MGKTDKWLSESELGRKNKGSQHQHTTHLPNPRYCDNITALRNKCGEIGLLQAPRSFLWEKTTLYKKLFSNLMKIWCSKHFPKLILPRKTGHATNSFFLPSKQLLSIIHTAPLFIHWDNASFHTTKSRLNAESEYGQDNITMEELI
jgi:hypothetical protein